MCGLIGMITSTLQSNERKAMKDLIYMDTLRGEHSTGIATYNKTDGTWYYKRAVAGPDFLQLGTPKRMLDAAWKVCMAHNRAATKGKVNDKNAHPFHHGNILGMHNGTLTSCTNLEDHTKFEVDSENIFYDMSKNGAEVTIPKLRGAFVLTWIDTDKGTFNICRNSQRPMYVGWNNANNLFMYASEEHMLRAAVSGDRQGRAEIHLQNIKELPIGEWIAIDMDSMKVHRKTLNLNIDPLPYAKTSTLPVATKQKGNSTSSQTSTSSESGKQNSTTQDTTTTSSSERTVRIVNWLPRVTHAGTQYIVTGSDTKHNQKSEVVISRGMYDLLCDEKAELPESITATFVAGVVRQGVYYNLCDGTVRNKLNFAKPVKEVKALPDKTVPSKRQAKAYKGFNNTPLSVSRLKKLLKVGCANSSCNKVASRNQSNQIMWLSHDEYLCPECNHDYIESKLAISKNNGVFKIEPVH